MGKKNLTDEEKVAADKVAADKVAADKEAEAKANADKEAADKEAADKEAADKEAEAKANAGEYVGKELTVKVGDAEFTGLCTSERTVDKGKQVYLKLAGVPSRYFSVKDIA